MGSFWFSLLLVVHIIVGCSVIAFVLLQHGKGADMGAAFGSGASGSLFGSSGSANFLSRTTGVLAAVFFATSLLLSYVVSGVDRSEQRSLMDSVSGDVPVAASVPVTQEVPK